MITCGFCKREIKDEDVELYFLEGVFQHEEQCPYCGYHAGYIGEIYNK